LVVVSTTTNGNDARDLPWSPGSDHTRPGDRMMPVPFPGDLTIVRTVGTRCSPCVKNPTLNSGVGPPSPGQPARAPDRLRPGTGSVPRNVCRAGAAAPIGMK